LSIFFLIPFTIQEPQMKRCLPALLIAVACLIPSFVRADDKPEFGRKEVIYGRKYGVALTMDVFTPSKDANGAGIIVVVSGGWVSNHDAINTGYAKLFLDKGYTVFAVCHGCQPKFAIDEILQDMHRAVRYIHHNAKEYGVDPDRLGITGGSAGGHLSLMQGCAATDGNPKAADPVERESSRVAAVACYYPPTDFLNWGKEGTVMLGRGIPVPVLGAFDFRQLDPKTGALERITDEDKIKQIGKDISPIYHVSKTTPPTLIAHGDKDPLVPLQQSEAMMAKLKEAGVPSELIVQKGGGHDGEVVKANLPQVLAWFDKYLAKK
jgi:acetyl esterase/lipase